MKCRSQIIFKEHRGCILLHSIVIIYPDYRHIPDMEIFYSLELFLLRK